MSIKSKQVLKMLGNYVLMFLLGIFLSAIFFSNGFAIKLFYLVLSLLSLYLFYQETQKMAILDKRTNPESKQNPLKGLVLGIITMIPVILLAIIIAYVTSHYAQQLDEWRENVAKGIKAGVAQESLGVTLRNLLISAVYLPVIVFVNWFGHNVTGYIISSLVIPLFSTLGYIAGFYNLEIGKKIMNRLGIKPPQPKKPTQRNIR